MEVTKNLFLALIFLGNLLQFAPLAFLKLQCAVWMMGYLSKGTHVLVLRGKYKEVVYGTLVCLRLRLRLCKRP